MRTVLQSVCTLAVVLAATLGPARPALSQVTDADVETSIKKIVKYFYDHQGDDGSWEHLYTYNAGHEIPNQGGITAVITLALMYSGESPQDPRLARAIDWLDKAKLTGCYSRAFRAHVYAHMPGTYMGKLNGDVEWLMNVSNDDLTFPHPSVGELGTKINPDTGKRTGHVHYDNSITQYGHLAIWEAMKRDVALPRSVFQQMADYWLRAQGADGGWGYNDEGARKEDAYASMTAAGITCLIIAEQGLYRKNETRDPKLAEAIERGFKWLDERFDGRRCVGNSKDRPGFSWYYIMCLERAALAGGITTLNGKDWFNDCAAEVTREVLASNDGTVRGAMGAADTAFALMFLARGRVPMWCSKVKLTNNAWNNRPNDIYFLNHFLSDYLESEMNWQIIGLDRPVHELRVTPVLYLSSDEAIVLTETEKANLKAYLEQGGMLVANAEKRSRQFTASIEALGKELFPRWELKQIDPDHPLLNATEQVQAGRQRGTVRTLHNGVRDIILLCTDDVGMQWQADPPHAWRYGRPFAVNLFVTACNRGVLENRLVAQRPRYAFRKTVDTLTVGQLAHEANSSPEPGFWPVVSQMMVDRAGIEISAKPVTFEELSDTSLPLVRLSGTGAIDLTDEQVDALVAYAQRGGWVLADNPGGNGEFASSVMDRIQQRVGRRFGVLLDEHPIMSGKSVEHAYEHIKLRHNRFGVALLGSTGAPPLIRVLRRDDGGEGGVIVVGDDLPLAMLNAPHWGVVGHSRESAERFLTNLLLYARHAANW